MGKRVRKREGEPGRSSEKKREGEGKRDIKDGVKRKKKKKGKKKKLGPILGQYLSKKQKILSEGKKKKRKEKRRQVWEKKKGLHSLWGEWGKEKKKRMDLPRGSEGRFTIRRKGG